MAPHFIHNRRWPRHLVEIPVNIVSLNGFLTKAVRGRGTNLNQGGMALSAGIPLDLGDVLHLDFLVPNRLRVSGVVRNRTGALFGLEFLALLPAEGATVSQSVPARHSTRRMVTGTWVVADRSPSQQNVHAILRRKQLEIDRVKREIEALRTAAPLLVDDQDLT
jgi:PilZ domain